MASLIQDLLKTPEQIRQERFDRLREGSRAQAQLLGATGTTALPGLLSGLAAQEMVASATDPAKMVQRGLLGAGSVVGSLGTPGTPSITMVSPDGTERTRQGTPGTRQRFQQLGSAIQQTSMTPDERQAAQVSAIARQAGEQDPERLRNLANQLREAGRPDAAQQFEERATQLEEAESRLVERARIASVLENQNRPDLAGLVRSGQVKPLDAIKEARLGEEKPEKPRARRVLTENARIPFEAVYQDDETLQNTLELMAKESGADENWWERNAPEFLGGAPSTDDKVLRLKEILFEEALQIVDENTNPSEAIQQALQKITGSMQSGSSVSSQGSWVLKDGQWVQQ